MTHPQYYRSRNCDPLPLSLRLLDSCYLRYCQGPYSSFFQRILMDCLNPQQTRNSCGCDLENLGEGSCIEDAVFPR